MRLLTGFFVAALFCFVAFAQNSGEPPIRVVQPGKGWSVGKQVLKRGDKLSAITEVIGSQSESVDLVLDCGEQVGWLTYSCTRYPCRVPVCTTKADGVAIQRVDPAIGTRSGVTAPSGSLFASLLRREPTALAVLGVRGAGGPNDAVVREENGKIHLGPALNRVLEGRYCLNFTPVPPGGALRTLTLNWDRSVDSEGMVSDSNMPVGLYALDKGNLDANGTCNLETDAVRAWVLIVPDAKFPPIQDEWKAYRAQLLDLERSAVSPTVLLTVRHAVLARLADEIETSAPQ